MNGNKETLPFKFGEEEKVRNLSSGGDQQGCIDTELPRVKGGIYSLRDDFRGMLLGLGAFAVFTGAVALMPDSNEVVGPAPVGSATVAPSASGASIVSEDHPKIDTLERDSALLSWFEKGQNPDDTRYLKVKEFLLHILYKRLVLDQKSEILLQGFRVLPQADINGKLIGIFNNQIICKVNGISEVLYKITILVDDEGHETILCDSFSADKYVLPNTKIAVGSGGNPINIEPSVVQAPVLDPFGYKQTDTNFPSLPEVVNPHHPYHPLPVKPKSKK